MTTENRRTNLFGWSSSLTALLALLSVGALKAQTAEPVQWTNLVNVSANGSTLTKTGGCGSCADAGASSTQTITSGDGYVEFTVEQSGTNRSLGLSNGDTDTTLGDIDFALQLWDGAPPYAEVRENGAYKIDIPYAIGDVFRISVGSGAVTYSKNGTVFYTSLNAPVYPLLVDSSLWTLNSTFTNVQILAAAGGAGVTWAHLVNVTPNGNTLEKTGGCDGCADAGATSTDSVASGDGYVEMTVEQTGTNRSFGLSNGDTDTSLGDIDFALQLWGTTPPKIEVRENGTYKIDTGVAIGDKLRVAVSGGAVQYSKNGAIFYTSVTAPTYPLLVDTSLWSSAATLSQVVLSNGVAPPPLCNQDAATHAPSQSLYDSFLPPAVGSAYQDPTYCSMVESLSNATDPGVGKPNLVSAGYATKNRFNLDNTMVLVTYTGQDSNGYPTSFDQVIDVTPMHAGEVLYNLNAAGHAIGVSNEPMWSHTAANVFYFHRGNQFLRATLNSDGTYTESVVHTFSEYGAIQSTGESDLSPDGDDVGFVGDNTYVFVYDISSDHKRGVLDLTPYYQGGDYELDKFQVGNQFMVVDLPPTQAGINLSLPEMTYYYDFLANDPSVTNVAQLADFGGHSDIGLNAQGHDVYYVSSAQTNEFPNCVYSILMYDLAQPNSPKCLLAGTNASPAFDWTLASHVAAPYAEPSWIYLDVYAPCDPQPGSPTQNCTWAPYTNEIIRMRTDDPEGAAEVQRLAYHWSEPYGGDSYDWQPRASVNADGSRVLFSSNFGFGRQIKQDNCNCTIASGGIYIDTYLLTVP